MNLYLVYKDSEFIQSNNKSDIDFQTQSVFEISTTDKIGKLYLNKDLGQINRLTAIRQANSICKTGFLLNTNERIGIKFKLEIIETMDSFLDKFNQKSVRIHESLIKHFWEDLKGNLYDKWEELPPETRRYFNSLKKGYKLSEQEIQKLFSLRDDNDKPTFLNKLKKIQET